MDRVRKWMTIAAIVGTVLVTAVFCYMPVREALKEYKKNTVSMEKEHTIGTLDDSAEILHENMADVSEEAGDDEKSESPVPGDMVEKREIGRVVFSFGEMGQKLKTTLWVNGENVGYVFLPGFAKDKPLQVTEITGANHFVLGSQTFYEGDVVENLSYEEAYAFTLFDKKGTESLSIPLIFMCSSELPVLCLETESGSMERIDASKEWEESGNVALYGEDGKFLFEGEAESISGRGNSTFGLLKKPYKFKLREGADLFGFGKGEAWNLLADGYDETKLRNQIVFGLAKVLGMEFVPDGQSVEVYCNGIYYGMYYLCEKIEIGEERVEIADMEEHTKAVYSQTELENLETVEAQDGNRKWTTSEVEAQDVTGGYLFEREIGDRYRDENSGFVTEQGDSYVLSGPRYATQAQVNYIADYMQEFQDALWEKDGIHKKTKKHYSEYIDMDSFVKKYLLEEVSKNYDGGVTSSFFYKKADAQGGKLYAGPAWDYDVAFGNCNLDKIVANPVGLSKLNDHIYATEVFVKLYEKEEFREKVIATYKEKVVPYLEELLDAEIDELISRTEKAVKADSIRWEALSNRYQYYEEYDNEIRFLKDFIAKRKSFLDEVWLEGEVYHSITFMSEGFPWKKVYVKDGETAGVAPIPARYSSLFIGWYSEASDVPYDEFKPVYEDMVFYALWQQLEVEEIITVTGAETE